MRRIVRLVIALSILAGVAAPTTFAAQRMWVGFHDDPSFRWALPASEREVNIAGSAQNNATIMRLLVQWNVAAKTRPANASDPFDPAYEFDDLDEAVRTAQQNDQEVILTISGTPKWANGGKTPNFMPTRVSDFTAFARAIASRYSGRIRGLPVRAVLLDLERAQPAGFPTRRSSTSAAARSPRRTMRSSPPPATRGSRRGARVLSSPSARRPPRGSDKPTGIRPIHSPGNSPSSSRRRTRG